MWLAVGALVFSFLPSLVASDDQWKFLKSWSNSVCSGTPEIVSFQTTSSCSEYECELQANGYYMNISCEADVSTSFAQVDEAFDGNTYVLVEYYSTGSDCETLTMVDAYSTASTCVVVSRYYNRSAIAIDWSHGSARLEYYNGTNCDVGPYEILTTSSTNFSSTECIAGTDQDYKLYSGTAIANYLASSDSSSTSASGSARASTSSGSSAGSTVITSNTTSRPSLSTGAIAGIVVAVVVIILALLLFIWCRRWRERANTHKDQNTTADAPQDIYLPAPSSLNTDGTGTRTGTRSASTNSSRANGPRSLGGLWEDEAIATARISRRKVIVNQLISRGGFGEVYEGRFNDQRVAVKMLLPEFRKDVVHLNAFLAEVKLMTRLDHPRIVQFVGVAWDALTDLCVVSEFMEGGDLRTLLDTFERQHHATDFDQTKITIAMHVAHALAYLHSLAQPVLHRDLKSRNVLLSSALDAKLTDFGTSRERADATMTGGVGTMLWMAPEVMMGEKYDDKADMFSFGVLLSELDTQKLPYSQARESMDENTEGREKKLLETIILQRVALGQLRVEFSFGALETVVSLGEACVSVDPSKRPTAAEALYTLHSARRQISSAASLSAR